MANLLQSLIVRLNRWHSVHSYRMLLSRERKKYPGDDERAMMATIGAATKADFEQQGDHQVAVLRHHGLRDGMAIYDLGCGCGRTAIALQRAGWTGHYRGADVIKGLTDYLSSECPGYEAFVHRELSIVAADGSQDMIFHWSVFTHLYPEQCYIYLADIFRALKPGGKLVFSFLEFEDPRHHDVFRTQVLRFRKRGWSGTLDTFLHRDWLRFWAQDLGFTDVEFRDGSDASEHPALWQSLVAMRKPVA